MTDTVAAFLFGGPRHRERVEISRTPSGGVPTQVVVAVAGSAFEFVYNRRGTVRAGYADFRFDSARPRPEVAPKPKVFVREKKVKPVPEKSPEVIQLERSDGSNVGLSCSCCFDGSPCEGLGI